MTFAKGSGIPATDWQNPQTRQAMLACLILVLAALLYYNFLLTPELKFKQQLTTQIRQIKAGLIRVQAATKKFEQENSLQSLQDRESTLSQLLPSQWERAELLRRLTKAIMQNGLQFEEQIFEESAPQALIQTLKIRLKLSGEYANFQQFLKQLKQGPSLLVLEKLLLVNSTPAEKEPKLKIEMVLSAHKRLELPENQDSL